MHTLVKLKFVRCKADLRIFSRFTSCFVNHTLLMSHNSEGVLTSTQFIFFIFRGHFLVHLTLTLENVFFQCGTLLLASAGGRFVIDTCYKQLM